MRNDLSALDTAVELLARGFWPIVLYPPGATIRTRDGYKPATGKEPVGKGWGLTKPTEARLRSKFRQQPKAGVGVLLGPKSGVIDFEVDGAEGEQSLRDLFGGEPPATLGWSSRRGPHRLFGWDGRLTALGKTKITDPKFPGLEIRLGGVKEQLQSAVPPTLGEDCRPRLWNGCDTLAVLPESVLRLLTDALVKSNPIEPREVNGKPAGFHIADHPNLAERWFHRALECEAGKVAMAREGDRHSALLSAARTLGGMLHHGHLTQEGVFDELSHAAKRAGLPQSEVAETIRDGLAYGKAAPLPWPEKLKGLGTTIPDTSSIACQTKARTEDRETQAEMLLRLASTSELSRTYDGRAFARVPVGSHCENHEVRSSGFKKWLVREFYLEQLRPPSSDALQGALGVLEARAQFDGSTEAVHVRVAPADDGAVCLDLGDDTWRAIQISSDGWKLTDRPSVRFRRPSGLRPNPTPEQGGSVSDLLPFTNVPESDFPLLVAWITAALLPTGPYPILALSGEQGSAKSTLARMLRRLIDPHACPLRSEPKDTRDLMVSATNGWVVAFDNLSSLPPWLSDALCRLATGGGFATRQLYSDSEEVFLDAQRPTILTGIEDYVRRGDLADRCIFLHLPTIPEANRRTEAEFWSEFDAAQPRLFGALLTAVASGLRLLPQVTLPRLPRMADFAKWGEAVNRSIGEKPGAFLDAYLRNRRDANEVALDDSPVAHAIRELMAGLPEWEGTATELLGELNTKRPDPVASRNHWPKTPRGLAGHLRRLAPALRATGLHIAFRVDRERRLRLSPVNPGEEPSQPAQARRDSACSSLAGDGCARCDGCPPAQSADRTMFDS